MEVNASHYCEPLAAITVNLIIDRIPVKECLMWSLDDNIKGVTPMHFAQSLCMDLDLPPSFELPIADEISLQLEAAKQLYARIPPCLPSYFPHGPQEEMLRLFNVRVKYHVKSMYY